MLEPLTYNRKLRLHLACVVVLPLVVFAFVNNAPAEPLYYNQPYLTWQGSPSTTMTITFHTASLLETVEVMYDITSKPEAYARLSTGTSWQIPGLPDGRYINSVELTGLTPGQEYYFRLGLHEGPSPEYAFRTIPDTDAPLRFAIGGDTLATFIFETLMEHMAKQSPSFFVIGGDLSYADGDFEKIERWDSWFEIWHEHDTTPDGHLIPLVLGIGNHETNRLEGDNKTRAPFYFGFFPQGGKPYFAHTFGDNLGMIILDSSHLVAPEDQVDWLEEQLKAHAALPFRTAVYHVPLYPSHRAYDGSRSVAGRTHWMPLFDTYQLSVGFENHDHTFKRTKRLRNNEVHPEGTLYVGDGNAGVMPRIPEEGRWYMEKVSRESHFWLVDISPGAMRLYAVDRNGAVFDEAHIEPRPLTDLD